jgi:hypothetical protein
VFKNWVLRKIFGLKREEVTGDWRKLHNEELHGLYCSLSVIRMIKWRRMRWVGNMAHMGEKRNVCRIFVMEPEGKRSLERPRHGWENNIKMDIKEIGWEGVEWIDVAQDRDKW